MKITFVGAHGTGKTTLVNYLQKELENRGIKSVITPEVPRIICSLENNQHFFRRESNTLLKQISLLFGQTVYENVADQSKPQVVLCDRSVVDHWSYTKFLFPFELERSEISNALIDFIKKHCMSYTHIFYVPIEFLPEDDGIREGDIDFQKSIDKEIYQNLKNLDLPFDVVKGSITERIDTVLEILEFKN